MTLTAQEAVEAIAEIEQNTPQQVKKMRSHARIAARAIRDEAKKAIEKSEKSGDISEDESFTKKETIQTAIDSTNSEFDELFNQKEQELKA